MNLRECAFQYQELLSSSSRRGRSSCTLRLGSGPHH